MAHTCRIHSTIHLFNRIYLPHSKSCVICGCHGELPLGCSESGLSEGQGGGLRAAVVLPGSSTEEGHLNLRSKDGFLDEVMRQSLS